MKFYLQLFSALFFFSSRCAGQEALADSIITKESLQQTVAFLAADSLEGRLTGTAKEGIATAYIEKYFRDLGLVTFDRTNGYFNKSFFYSGKRMVSVVNVAGVLEPAIPNDTLVIISAHYDHIGRGDDFGFNASITKNDSVFNGANDNATGIAAMMALAKFYAVLANNRYTLVFVAFSGEEYGLMGSQNFSDRLGKIPVAAVINLEMLGRPGSRKLYITAKKPEQILARLNGNIALQKNRKAIKVFEKDYYPEEGLIFRSDHYSFFRHTEMSFTIFGSHPKDRFYHTVQDEYRTIQFDNFLKITRQIALATTVFTTGEYFKRL